MNQGKCHYTCIKLNMLLITGRLSNVFFFRSIEKFYYPPFILIDRLRIFFDFSCVRITETILSVCLRENSPLTSLSKKRFLLTVKEENYINRK